MPGQLGNVRVTAQNLQIVATDVERGLIMVKGAVPGSKGGFLMVRDAVKRPAPEGAPYPASLRGGAEAPAAAEEAPAEEPAADEAPAQDAEENKE